MKNDFLYIVHKYDYQSLYFQFGTTLREVGIILKESI